MFTTTTITTATILALTTASFAERADDSLGDGASPLQDANSQPQQPLGCAGDTDNDFMTDVNDLSRIYVNWGFSCSEGCRLQGDLNGDGLVDVMDLILVVTNWGACEVDEQPADPKPDAYNDDLGDGSNPTIGGANPDTPGRTNPWEDELGDGSSGTPGGANDDAAPYPWIDHTGDGINPHDPDADGGTIGDANSDSPWDDYLDDDMNPRGPADNPIPGGQPQDEPQDGELDFGDANGRR